VIAPRVLVLADATEGGLGAVLAAHVQALRARGAEVVVLAGDPMGRGTVAGATLWDLPAAAADLGGMRRATQQARQVARRFQPDVVHAHGGRAGLVGRAITWGQRPRLLVTFHTSVPFDVADALGQGPKGWAFLAVPLLLPRPRTAAVTRLPGWRSQPIRSPRAVGSDEPGRAVGAGHRIELAWIGRLDAPKRTDLLIALARALAARGRPVDVCVIGSGPRQDQLAQDANDAGVDISFVGQAADPWAHVAPDAVVTVLSDSEAVNFVVQEAMARGRVVVATALASVVWLGGEAFIRCDDVEVTADRLASLTSPQAAELGAQAASRYRQMASQLASADDLAVDTLTAAGGASPVPVS
jgi:glycosyltransferase involved in cell wall biosynthesis